MIKVIYIFENNVSDRNMYLIQFTINYQISMECCE